MSSNHQQQEEQPLRLWPGVVIVLLVAALLFIPGNISDLARSPIHFYSFFLAPFIATLLAIVWWVGFARVRGVPRWLVPLLFLLPAILSLFVLPFMLDENPMGVVLYGLPAALLLWVGWLLATPMLTRPTRILGVCVLLIVCWSIFSLLRVDGTSRSLYPEMSWRWTKPPEDQAQQEVKNRKLVAAAAPAARVTTTSDWAEFRGPNRDGKVTGLSIAADWNIDRPTELWKQKIGPGWGNFAVVGDRLFTQEQRGDDEGVVCYEGKTGGEIWRYFEPNTKFKEPISGAGPRATPTVHEGRVYAQGATGMLFCLSAEDGRLLWKKNICSDTGGIVPQWGYSGSPLVIDGRVIVYTGGPNDKGTSAFSATDGAWLWSAGKASHSYSSAQRTTIAGVEQVLMMSNYGLESFDPATGKVLWEYHWGGKDINRVTQPTVIAEGEFLIGTGVGGDQGTRRIKVTRGSYDWDVKYVWFQKKARPYYNDGVVHEGHFYGFNDKSLICVDLADGSIKWEEGANSRYGQLLLLADQGLLIVQAEDGKIHLVKATPTEHSHEGTLEGIPGKTWNHPVVAGGRLYVRNGAWAAAYELKRK